MVERPHAKWTGQIRSFKPEMARLETRELMSTGLNLLSVVPNILTSPKGQTVSVVVEGYVIRSSLKETPVVQYQVIDQYHRDEPHGRVPMLKLVSPTSYRYKIIIPLVASRSHLNGPNAIGRQYDILVTTTDAQNTAVAYAAVLVPLNPNKPPKPIHVLPGL